LEEKFFKLAWHLTSKNLLTKTQLLMILSDTWEMLLNNSTFKGILLLGLQLGLKQQDVVKSGTKLKKKMAKFVSL